MSFENPLGDALKKKGFVSSQERQENELQEKFDRVLKDKFKDIKKGTVFQSSLPGVDSVLVGAPLPTKDHPIAESANVTVFYSTDKGERHADFSINKKGMLIGRPPRELEEKFTRNDLYEEVLTKLEEVGLKFWLSIKGDILPPGEWPEGEASGKSSGSEHGPVLDMERISFLKNQPDVRFGFLNPAKGGFSGYRGFVFEDFIVLEHPMTKNAAYFIDGIPSFDMPEDASNEERSAILNQQPWVKQLSQENRLDLRKSGAKFVIHRENWQEEMQQQLDKRRKKQTGAKATK